MVSRFPLAGLFLILLSAPTSAIETTDPTRMTGDIFALYGKKGRGFDVNAPDARQVLAPGLLALVDADRKAAGGEVGALDFDPFCGCQDFDVTAVRVTPEQLGPGKAEISVAFRNFGKPGKTRLSLVKTSNGWRVSDIHTGDVPSLVALLRRPAR